MDVTAYVLLSHEQALRRRLDVVANNMANSSTAGFRREQPLFHEYVAARPETGADPLARTSFVLDHGAIHDTRPGAFQPTGNPLDLMIEGPGYLSVEGPDGAPLYTRAGFVRLLESGELATSGGQRILGEDGRPIVVPPGQAEGLAIAADGTVAGPQGTFGRIAVTRFDDERALDPRGDGMMTGEGGRVLPAAETRLRSGGVEGSNVEPIVETTAMVEILRTYQTSQRMSESLGDMRRRAIERLGRAG
jgi:flagellar basal-body rod protein FlgF